jgi:hypothetical protein
VIIIVFARIGSQQINVNASEEEVSSAIGKAEDALKLAFRAVLEAEEAGADVSHLIFKLNMACADLVGAKNAYRAGNFSDAFIKVEQCSALVDGVIREASNLRNAAFVEAKSTFLSTLIFSVACTAIFLVLLTLIWSLFRRYYIRKLLKAKPEAAYNVEA